LPTPFSPQKWKVRGFLPGYVQFGQDKTWSDVERKAKDGEREKRDDVEEREDKARRRQRTACCTKGIGDEDGGPLLAHELLGWARLGSKLLESLHRLECTWARACRTFEAGS
jgi:hypothetical protein